MTNNDGSKQFYIVTSIELDNPNRIYYENAQLINKAYIWATWSTDLLAKAHADFIAVQVWDSNALEALAVALGFKPEQVVIPLASNDIKSIYSR